MTFLWGCIYYIIVFILLYKAAYLYVHLNIHNGVIIVWMAVYFMHRCYLPLFWRGESRASARSHNTSRIVPLVSSGARVLIQMCPALGILCLIVCSSWIQGFLYVHKDIFVSSILSVICMACHSASWTSTEDQLKSPGKPQGPLRMTAPHPFPLVGWRARRKRGAG